MIISYASNIRDEAIAASTLNWAYQLDGKVDYDCVLTLGDGVQREPIIEAAERYFRNVTVLSCDGPNSWPMGKNIAFQNLVRHLDSIGNRDFFLWMEPDGIPLKKGWLATIEATHLAGGKPFSGYVHPAIQQMDCVGVYPHNFMEYSPRSGMLCRAAPWDQCARAEITPHAHAINHLLQMVHDVDGFPPTFGGENAPTLLPSAVLFHSCKDGTLVKQLSKGTIERLFGGWMGKREVSAPKKELITVVFPVCNKDAHLAVHHAKWLKRLGKWDHKAIIASDTETAPEAVTELTELLTQCFSSVVRFIYPAPAIKQWPQSANWAFARVAEYMAHGTAAWLWMEADACATRADWLHRIQAEYDAAKKPFMGAIVPDLNHLNGVAVYPHNTPSKIPRALAQNAMAWDFAARPEMAHDCHNASDLFWHAWGVVNGKIHHSHGPCPDFQDIQLCKQLPREAVVAHRSKTPALIDYLHANH